MTLVSCCGYGIWKVLGRLRQRPTAPSIAAVKYARQCFDQGAAFVGWLHGHGLTLGTCSQHDLDRWLADGPNHRHRARYLLTWAADRGGITDIELPRQAAYRQQQSIDDDSRWREATRFLTDERLDPADRSSAASSFSTPSR